MTPLYSINQEHHMGYFGYQFDHYVVTITQLSLSKFESLVGWLTRLANQTTNIQQIVFSCKNQGTIIH